MSACRNVLISDVSSEGGVGETGAEGAQRDSTGKGTGKGKRKGRAGQARERTVEMTVVGAKKVGNAVGSAAGKLRTGGKTVVLTGRRGREAGRKGRPG